MVPCVAVLLVAVSCSHALDISQCIAPLGMQSGLIPDKDLSASSSFNDGNVGPQNGRLNQEIKGGAWCPKSQITTETSEWLEVDLRAVHVVTAVGTQGRFGNGQGAEYAEAYVVEYWRPKLGKWVRYRGSDEKEILSGNTNTYLEKKNHLDPPIWASKIRVIPYSFHRRTVCMRVELYGCYWSVGIVSYSMPKGDKRSNGIELTDMTYDGQWGDEMRGGLGQLVDGQFGGDEIREANRNSAWVGWRNDSRPNPPAIVFEFDKVREFSAVHLFCNNKFMREVQVFSEAVISFSIGGHHYQDEPIRFTNVADNIFESARNVTIKLHHRIGRWVRVELRFSSRWILISEVVFDSDVAQGNYTPESHKPPAGKEKTKLIPSKEIPISTAHQDDPLYMAIVVGVLTALVILLAVAVFLIIHRHRHRKCFASPLAKTTVSKREQDSYSRCGTSSHVLPVNKNVDCSLDVKSDEYQEPYQALKCAPYFSYSTVLLEMKDFVKDSNTALSDSSNYDYAVPELSSAPLLTKRRLADSLSERAAEAGSLDKQRAPDARRSAAGSLRSQHSARSASQQEVLIDLKRRLETTTVIEFPRHRLRMISKLAEGAFGTVYVAEADGVPEYSGAVTADKRLVAVKFLCHDASAKERDEFERDVRILAALSSPYLARVLGACRSPPLAVVLEYLELGDLCALLRAAPPPPAALIHVATQIAAGMAYLESLNFVHRDLAARYVRTQPLLQIQLSSKSKSSQYSTRAAPPPPAALIHVATQIAAGMAYLESLNFVHRDLAARYVRTQPLLQIQLSSKSKSSQYSTRAAPPPPAALIHVATQIAAGMAYLESLNFVHRDLAARYVRTQPLLQIQLSSKSKSSQYSTRAAPPPPAALIHVATQIAAGMAYLESLNFVHRDLAARYVRTQPLLQIQLSSKSKSSQYSTRAAPPPPAALIHVATQIAAGMAYLESLNFVHRDLAARYVRTQPLLQIQLSSKSKSSQYSTRAAPPPPAALIHVATQIAAGMAYLESLNFVHRDLAARYVRTQPLLQIQLSSKSKSSQYSTRAAPPPPAALIHVATQIAAGMAYLESLNFVHRDLAARYVRTQPLLQIQLSSKSKSSQYSTRAAPPPPAALIHVATQIAAGMAYLESLNFVHRDLAARYVRTQPLLQIQLSSKSKSSQYSTRAAPPPPAALIHVATQIAAGMAYLESLNFVHRDLAARYVRTQPLLQIQLSSKSKSSQYSTRAAPPPPAALIHVATQIAAGMAYLESLNFVHRDLAARYVRTQPLLQIQLSSKSKSSQYSTRAAPPPPAALIHVATQIAAGMAYLESLNFVHRDLAARYVRTQPLLQIQLSSKSKSSQYSTRAAPPPPAALIHVATQIAAGMAYLESLNFVHRDLAARYVRTQPLLQIQLSSKSKSSQYSTRAAPPPPAALIHVATQIAAGMAYLESLNFVHRDLAARNILVGKGYQIKISDFGTDNEAYARDYHRVDGRAPLPLRWAAWESVLHAQYTTKSDAWAFGVTLHELFTACRRPPYDHLTDHEVLENLTHLQLDDGHFCPLGRPAGCPRDLHELMLECWQRDQRDRPAFAEMHLFLQRKAIPYT